MIKVFGLDSIGCPLSFSTYLPFELQILLPQSMIEILFFSPAKRIKRTNMKLDRETEWVVNYQTLI